MKGIWEYSMELWKKINKKDFTKKNPLWKQFLQNCTNPFNPNFQPPQMVPSWIIMDEKILVKQTRVWQLGFYGQKIYDPVSFMIFSFRLPWRFSGSLMQWLFGVSGSATFYHLCYSRKVLTSQKLDINWFIMTHKFGVC